MGAKEKNECFEYDKEYSALKCETQVYIINLFISSKPYWKIVARNQSGKTITYFAQPVLYC